MEGYGLDELAASAELVVRGLGPLAAELAGLVSGLAGVPGLSFDQVEGRVAEAGRELLRKVVQLVMDAGADGELRRDDVADAAGVPRPRVERDHARTMLTQFGGVAVRRLAYRAAGQANLHPRDAALNLPLRRYSWRLQRAVVAHGLAGAYELAQQFVLAATGVKIGKQQLELIIAEAAADAERFCRDRPGVRAVPGGEPDSRPLALSADGKGVAMRPEARRRTAKAPGERVRNFEHRRGTGEKGCKRMAEIGAVFDVSPPDPDGPPRTPEQIMRPERGSGKNGPRAVNRWYTADITAGRDVTIGKIFDEAERRDPAHRRTWIVLVDGDIHQISLVQAQAAARGIPVTILVDFIHVLEYLWKTAWCFHEPRDPAMEDWVITQALDILHGRVTEVITRIARLAEDHPPQSSEHARIIRKTLHYLDAKQPYMDYPAALANGWPIASSVIEGACRHLVQDRMGITGARWGLPGAQAILQLRAIDASGDMDAYWDYHIQQEHQRNHRSRYNDTRELAA